MSTSVARIIAGLFLGLFLAACQGGSGSDGQSTALLVTDVHFDPFRQPQLVAELDARPWTEWADIFSSGNDTIPLAGQTCGPALLDSLKANLARLEPAPDLILFPGDILAHNFKENYATATGKTDETSVRSFILKTVSYVMASLATVYPDSSMYFTLGNNDAYAGDYMLVANGPFLADTAGPLFEICIRNPGLRETFMATYPALGSYALDLPELKNVRLISLNTVFMSGNYPDMNGTQPGDSTLDWLESELEICRETGRTAWILTHIPLGIDVYATLHTKTPGADPTTFMKTRFNDRLIGLFREFGSTVGLVLTGHTHMDDFRLVFPEDTQSGALASMIVTPAITPEFAQNPGFRTLEVDRNNGRITDSTVFFLSLPAQDNTPSWAEEYVFSRTFGTAPDTAGLEVIHAAMPVDKNVREAYIAHYSAGRVPSLIAKSWTCYWCALGCLTPGDYRLVCSDCQSDVQKTAKEIVDPEHFVLRRTAPIF